MEQAIRLRVTVGADHTIRARVPDDVPAGDAEMILLVQVPDERSRRAEARKRLFGRLQGQATIADDFDAPLPEDVLRDFEGGEEP